jgi:hypothetical protein
MSVAGLLRWLVLPGLNSFGLLLACVPSLVLRVRVLCHPNCSVRMRAPLSISMCFLVILSFLAGDTDSWDSLVLLSPPSRGSEWWVFLDGPPDWCGGLCLPVCVWSCSWVPEVFCWEVLCLCSLSRSLGVHRAFASFLVPRSLASLFSKAEGSLVGGAASWLASHATGVLNWLSMVFLLVLSIVSSGLMCAMWQSARHLLWVWCFRQRPFILSRSLWL